MLLQTPPLALYVHFPWCVRKCPYCDFNSYTLSDTLPQERYLDALARDMQAQAADVAGRPVISVFFGGGTPSLFSPDAIHRVLQSARESFTWAADAEVTLEANPGTIERGRFEEYRAAGVNRVSLGAQSFDEARLKTLGRIHSPGDTRRAAEELHASGLTNFNLDLMYALPGQDAAGALGDLNEALALAPAHISHYQLTIEPGTVFAASPPVLPADDTADEILAVCQEQLARGEFEHYEVSAYARAGHECRHNLNYWMFGDYLGVGAGAHGKLTFAPQGTVVRTTQLREPRRYLAASPAAITRKTVAAVELPFEFMLNALRLVRGFEEASFAARTGLPLDCIAAQMDELSGRGLVEREGSRWRATPLGLRFLNDLLARFLPDPPVSAPERGVAASA
jgi:oxygen-independent coproporphyrinogen-3 oxidase